MLEGSSICLHRTWLGPSPLFGCALWVWVQGCPRRCLGCFNGEALSFDGGEILPIADLVGRCVSASANLVLSGGDPFAQADALAQLCRLVRMQRPEIEIMAYTGYPLEELLAGAEPAWLAFLAELDLLVDGPYEQQRASEHALLGSDNQRIVFLSDRIDRKRAEQLSAPRIAAEFTRTRLRLVGTGSAQMDMHHLVAILHKQGLVLTRERNNAE